MQSKYDQLKRARNFNTDQNGNVFSDFTKLQVWNKAQIVPGVEPAYRRKDACGAWIDWDQFNVTNENGTGWEIDHIKPVAMGGDDVIANLQPLQWQNNRKKGNDYPALDFIVVNST
ncbi:MAG: HNH endonuclease signature motif containing protein [Chryseolinea sp.]